MAQIVNMIVRVEKDLHREFKKLCVDEDTTIQEYVTRLIKNEVDKKKGLDYEKQNKII